MSLSVSISPELLSTNPTYGLPESFQFPGANVPLPNLPKPQPEETDDKPSIDGRVKIYPMIGFAANKRNLGGAWRAWTIARMIDTRGAGSVTHKQLSNKLNELGVNKSQRSRWLSDAAHIGLFRPSRRIYYLIGLGKAASIVSAQAIGLPALVDAHALMARSWRARVWSAYLCTLHEHPVSQNTKARLSGVDPRTQRNYQRNEPGSSRGNYAKTQYKPDQVEGLNQTTGGSYFKTRGGKVIKRLPDLRNVPSEVATPALRGRSRKAQQELNNLSFYVEREPDQPIRLFCGSPKQAKATERQLARDDRLPWHKPQEIYQLIKVGRRNNLFDTIHLGLIQ